MAYSTATKLGLLRRPNKQQMPNSNDESFYDFASAFLWRWTHTLCTVFWDSKNFTQNIFSISQMAELAGSAIILYKWYREFGNLARKYQN